MIDFLYSIIVYPLYQLVELCYYVCWKVVKNPGFAVIGVSLAVSFLCLPLYVIAEKWQTKERDTQKKLKSGIERIKSAFKGDEQYMILSAYYKENHYHPIMALRSSISLLIQIPFFMAAYIYLSHLGALQECSFYFIKDMGSPDAMFHIGTFAINVLPIAMTLINIIAGAIYSKGFPVKEKLQIYIMALVFLVLLYNSPSGLVLYWTMNNVFSLVKNVFYKFKKPLRALYFCLSAAVLFADWYLLFKHHGFLYRRLMLVAALSLVLLAPLIIKGINWLLNKPFKCLMENKKQRNILFILTGVALALLTGFVLPSYVVSSSPMEFSFVDNYNSPFYFLFHSLFQSIGFCVFWPCCIYFLFHEKTQTVMTLLGSIICFCAIINAFAFGGDYGTLSSLLTFTDAGKLKPSNIQALINFAILLIPVVIVIVLLIFNKTKWLNSVCIIVLFSFAGISIAHSSTISKGYKEVCEIRNNKNSLTENANSISPIFHFSKTGKNIFVIMLDRAVSGYLPYILSESPELYTSYDGFTFYPNTVSYADHTLIGAPPLYGGYDYTPEEVNKRTDVPLVEKHNESLLLLPRLFDEAGYKSTVTDPSWANYSWIPDTRFFSKYPNIAIHPTIRVYTDKWLKIHPEEASQTARSSLLKRNFIWFSFLKEMPLFFRDSIYNDGFWWNTDNTLENLQDVLNNYAPLDFLPKLTDIDENNSKGTFTCFVNELTHEPHYLQYPDYTPQVNVTNKGDGPFANEIHYHANAAAIKRLATWFDYLKQIGVYDNTRIIIVADHGAGLDTKVSPDQEKANLPFRIEAHNPLLLEKDFNSHGKIKTDNSFMTNADVPTMAITNVLQNAVNPYTGNPINEDMKKNGVHVVDNHLWSPDGHNKNTFKITDDQWYTVKDNIFVSSNWSKGKN